MLFTLYVIQRNQAVAIGMHRDKVGIMGSLESRPSGARCNPSTQETGTRLLPVQGQPDPTQSVLGPPELRAQGGAEGGRKQGL